MENQYLRYHTVQFFQLCSITYYNLDELIFRIDDNVEDVANKSQEIGRVGRVGQGSSRGCHEDATRKTVPWINNIESVGLTKYPYDHLTVF